MERESYFSTTSRAECCRNGGEAGPLSNMTGGGVGAKEVKWNQRQMALTKHASVAKYYSLKMAANTINIAFKVTLYYGTPYFSFKTLYYISFFHFCLR